MSDVVATAQQGLAGKYKQYPEYKDSGVEWLGEVPIDWGASRHKYIATFAKGKNPKELFDEVGIGRHQYLAMGFLRGLEVPKYCDLDSSTILVMENQILIIWDGSNAGEFVKATHGVLSSTMAAVTTNSNIHDGFYWYYCKSIEPEMRRHANGMGIPHVDGDELKAIVIPQPALEEQRSIAAFLDYETARIDRLIAQQQRLIELLKEKRQAVISHAITKGLNPNAPMKDSGVEWLGQVPKHWNVTKFGFISNVVRGGSPRPAGDPELFDGDYSPWVTVAEITKDEEVYLESTESFLTEKGSKQSRVFKRGTLLLSNSGATLGVPKILSIDANANDGVVGFEKLSVNTEYAYFYLSTLTDNLRERIKQGSGQPNLNTDIVKSIVIPLPPSGEVEAILSEIKTHRITFSVLISKADTAIKLMQERRTALISAAVTGKIDLRGWTPPAEEAAA
ncbi:MAG: restriction endonuclease subunit S [Aeromonas media]